MATGLQQRRAADKRALATLKERQALAHAELAPEGKHARELREEAAKLRSDANKLDHGVEP